MPSHHFWTSIVAIVINFLPNGQSTYCYSDAEIMHFLAVVDILPDISFSHLALLLPGDDSDLILSQISKLYIWKAQTSSVTFQAVSMR